MALTVLRPGLLSSIQDLGRPGYQGLGVSVSGAMDLPALRTANLLVGNDESAAGLELTLLGPTLEFGSPALLAICGGSLSPTIGDRPVPEWRPVYVRAGTVLRFGDCVSGCRAYLALAGGIKVPRVLGSRSTQVRVGLGGFEGRPLRAGDLLPCGAPRAPARSLMEQLAAQGGSFVAVPWSARPATPGGPGRAVAVRVTRGAAFESFTASSRRSFYESAYRVAPESDRMGYRLSGPRLELAAPLEPVSDAVSVGTVQVPPDGQPIALMADRQTTGGYPRIGHVISVDLPILAQLKPGDSFTFREISLDAAQEMYLAREREFEDLRQGLAVKFAEV